MSGHGNPSDRGHGHMRGMAPKLRRRPCRLRCGAHVDTFTTHYGRPVALDTEPPPIDRDLSGMRGRVFEYHGPYIGWVSKTDPSHRTWRELRTVHECANPTPTTEKGNDRGQQR